MTFAFRSVTALLAIVAGYYAVRLVFAFAGSRRQHIAFHVVWMSCALTISAGLVLSRMTLRWEDPVDGWDLLATCQVLFLYAGLRPVWSHHRTRPPRVPSRTKETPMTNPTPTPEDYGAASVALDTGRDARNRFLRTALQAVLVMLAVDVVPVLVAALDSEDVDYGEVGKAILRVVLLGGASFVMRYAAPPPAPGG